MPFQHGVCGAQRRFHHAAGRAENDGGARALAERRVKLLLRQIRHIDPLEPQQAVHLAGREHGVHIPEAGAADLRHAALVFFRGARHNGDAENVLRIDVVRFGKPRFRHRAEHLLRGFGRGQLRHHIGVFQLQKAHPAGTARGEERAPEFPRMLHFIKKLVALLHDREIGGKVRVKDVVGACGAEGRRHTLFGSKLLGETKPFAPRGTHRRSDLQHNDLFRIVDRGNDLFGIVPFAESAGRAVGDALAAVGAVDFVEPPSAAHADGGAAAGAEEIPYVHALDLLAHGDAAEALHAL